nr:ulp1 protease family, C-terminal catalytic domain-containing protein [Tanacetum cinerariifolium]
MIEEKISMISTEKIALEDLLKKANAEFPNDEKVIELCEKYRRLFKESLFVKDFQAHIDDSDNNDDDGGGKNDDHGSDNVRKKKESVAKDVVNAEKDRVNAEKDGVNAVQEGRFVCVASGCSSDISCVSQTPQRVVTRSSPNKRIVKPHTYLTSPYMNKRTKVTSIIKRLEFMLGNSLFSMQGDKYETVFQTRFGHDLSSVHLNMETLAPRLWIDAKTKAIIEWIIDEEHQWKVFSYEISAQLRSIHDDSLPVGQWDLGLCEESDDQVLMLRCMRFKIATKSLLHEFNVHAEKMFHLAFKFESENDEETRISIIVNAIKK